MRIDFFEEFPDKASLSKAKLISFNSTIYLAARSLEEFNKKVKLLRSLTEHLDVAYWPVLSKSYWVSPFSYTYELEHLLADLRRYNFPKRLKVLIDLELPILNKKLFLVNLLFFEKNKKLIEKILKNKENLNIDIITAEILKPIPLLKLVGISYPQIKSLTKTPMYYSSMTLTQFLKDLLKSSLVKELKGGGKIQVGLGTIAKGILGNEPVLSPKGLQKDLEFFEKVGFKTAVIFRLGGLNNRYIKVLEKFIGKSPFKRRLEEIEKIEANN